MNGTGKLIMMAVIGILVAAAIIGGVNALTLPSGSTTITTSIVSTSTSLITSTKISITNSTVPKGTLATQIADVLNLPLGITHVYVSYSDIEVHTGIGNQSVWYSVVPAGEIDLLSLSGESLTSGVTHIQAGTYDLVRLSMSSVNVTYQGRNVSAVVPLAPITVPILDNGVQLQTNGTSGLVVDIAPSIIPSQTINGTQIQIVPYAKAVPIPSSISLNEYAKIGARIPLISQPWFSETEIDLQSNLTIITALVTSNALLLVVKDTGNYNVTISGLYLLAPNVSSSDQETQNAPDSSGFNLTGYQIVASFLVLNNKEIVQASSFQDQQQLGLQLSPGENASLTFAGNIATLNSVYPPFTPQQILAGSQYILQIEAPFGQTKSISVSAISSFG